MQTLLDCAHYQNNDNLNKTCTKDNKRCELYYANYCPCYLCKGDNNASRK